MNPHHRGVGVVHPDGGKGGGALLPMVAGVMLESNSPFLAP